MATTSPSAMATKILLPVTVCFLLLVLATDGKNATVVLDFEGAIARCKSNSSRIISNAPLNLYLVINNNVTVSGTVTTTDTGMIPSIAVNLTSSEQLDSLLTSNGGGKSKAFLVAPPRACGAPSIPPGQKVAAPVHAVLNRTATIVADVAEFACAVICC